METKEKRNDEKKFTGWPNEFCCGPQNSDKTIPDCCANSGKDGGYRSTMNQCMKGCRWFPILAVVLGICFLLLGYFLNPEITRILWMVVAGFVILMSTVGLLIMRKMKKICCG